MADFAVTFAEGSDAYTFPNVQSFRDTFGDMVPRTMRALGVSGGVDQYGSEAAPAEIGQVQITCKLYAASRDDMQAAIDAIRALARLGLQKLTLQPQGSEAARWCYARVNNISVARRPAEQTDRVQLVRVALQVPDPHWYHDEESQIIYAAGLATEATITNSGNAPALARFTLAPETSDSCENPAIKRMVAAVAVETVSYVGTLTDTDSLVIDCEVKSAQLNGTDVYADMVIDTPHWFWLLPGSNTVRVELANAGDACDVTIAWKDTYR